MQTPASPPDSGWLDLRSRLPPGLDLDALAFETKAIQRKRGIGEAEDLLRLALVRGPGGKSLKETRPWAHLNGIAEISAPCPSARLHGSVAFFAALTGRLLAAGRPAKPSAWRGRCLHLCDASSLSERGSKGTDWRIHATYDLAGGRFSHLELTGAKAAGALRRAPCPEAGVTIADGGYAKAGEMATFRLSQGGLPRDFIVRSGWNMPRLATPKDGPFDLIDALREMEKAPNPENAARERAVGALYGRGKSTKRLPIRLIVKPLPAEQAGIARAKVRRASSKRQNQLDPRSELAAGFLMLATSLPAGIPADEICAVYRMRWQACPCEGEGRAGLQTVEIPAAHRPNTDVGREREPELALLASHPRPVDRRRLPGNPGISSLWTMPPTIRACRPRGRSRPLSSHCCAPV